MKEIHIIDILDSNPVGSLDEGQLHVVRRHVENCASCSRAYDAALVSSNILHARVAIAIEPSPFFATRVLAAVREQQTNNVPVMLRLWRSASFLVSSMAVTTAALAVMSVVIPGPTASETATVSPYSAEAVILNDDNELTYEQVLSTIYADEEEAK